MWKKLALLGATIGIASVYIQEFTMEYTMSKNFKHFDIESQEVRVEHRSNVNALLIVFQKTGYFPINGFLFQSFASVLTEQFNAANVDFALTGTDPTEEIRTFSQKHGITADVEAGNKGLWEWSKRPREYKNLNEFFMRRYRTFDVDTTSSLGEGGGGEGTRSIALLLTSPATSVVRAYSSLGSMGGGANAGMLIKGERVTMESSGVPDYAQYSGFRCFYFYLSPADYHCFHSPVAGTIERVVDFTRLAHSSGSVKPDLLGTSPSILTHNRRIVVVIKRGELQIALVIIGGFLVDSIRMDPAVQEGRTVETGQYLGAFALGGSAILMLSNQDLDMVDKLAKGQEATQLPVKVYAGKEFVFAKA